MITICCAQIQSVWEDPESSLVLAAEIIEMAASGGASLIAFPEQFATGWDPSSHSNVQDIKGSVVRGFRTLAHKNNIAVLGSFREAHSPLPRNTSIAIGPDGSILASYSKTHLFSPAGEQEAFSAGDSLATFSLEGVCFGIAICYDLRFSGLFTACASRGTDCILVPAAWPCSRMKDWEIFLRCRALEAQCYIAGINTTGKNPVDTYCGHSMVCDPSGEPLNKIIEGAGLIYSSINPELVTLARAAIPSLSDHRDEFYRQQTQKY